MIICLGRPLPERLDATDPGVMTPRDTRLPLYAVLLQVGFAKPASSPKPLVRSYRTVSPLPAALRSLARAKARWRFVFCCTFRGLAPPGGYPAPCPVEFGLSSSEALVHRVKRQLRVPHPRSPGRLGAQDTIQCFVDQLIGADVGFPPHRNVLEFGDLCRRMARLEVQRLQALVLDAVLPRHLPHHELGVHVHFECL